MSEVQLKGNDQVIEEALEDGHIREALDRWTTDDLIILKLEMAKGNLIAGIIEADDGKLIAALMRLGWADNLVNDIKAIGGVR